MVTVSHIVAKLIRNEPVIEDALAKDLFNYSKLASYFRPSVEKEIGKPVKPSAIVMAVARHSEKIRQEYSSRVSKKTFAQAELAVRSGVAEITIQKSTTCFSRLAGLYRIVDLSSGDILNINIGGSEVSVIFSERYAEEFKRELSDEKTKMSLSDLSEITIRFPKDYLYEPGFIYTITRHLAWYNINIIEMVSTLSELIIVIKSDDATQAYSALQELFSRGRKKQA